MKLLIFTFAIFFSLSVLAGEGVIGAGDGGHGVICKTGYFSSGLSNYTIELLDLFESRRLYGTSSFPKEYRWIQKDELGFLGDWLAKDLKTRIEQVKEHSADASVNRKLDKIYELAATLAREIRIGENLPTTSDYGKHISLPKNCSIFQMAIFQRTASGIVIWFDLDAVEYANISELSATLLHETLHLIYPNDQSTERIRQIVIYIFATEEFQKANQQTFRL